MGLSAVNCDFKSLLLTQPEEGFLWWECHLWLSWAGGGHIFVDINDF